MFQTDNNAIEGVDVSYYQMNIDYNKMAQTNVAFMYIRGAAGTTRDKMVDHHVGGCKRIGMPFGLYYAVFPEYPYDIQAKFHAKMENEFDPVLPPVLDIERNGGLTQSQLTKWLLNWIKMFEDISHKTVMIYTSWGFFNYSVSPDKAFSEKLLWLADYTAPPDLPVAWSKYGKSWTIWQDGYRHNISDYGVPKSGAKKIDHNYFYGKKMDFYDIFGVYPRDVSQSPGCEPLQDEAENKPKYVITTSAINPRTGPGIAYADAGTIFARQRLEIVGDEQNGFVPVRIWLSTKYPIPF